MHFRTISLTLFRCVNVLLAIGTILVDFTKNILFLSAFQGMVVTFGSKGGAGVFNGWNLPSFAIGLLKGRTLFSDKFWKMMGQEMP